MKIRNIVTLIVLAGLVAGPVYAKNDKDKKVPPGLQKKTTKGQSLPPGLQKKVAKGQSLPPGWQKKLAKGEVMDKRVYQHGQIVVPVDSRGLVTIGVEGKLVRLYQATREIVEILK